MPNLSQDAVKRNTVWIDQNRVVKIFSHGPNKTLRFCREIQALQRLAGLDGVPEILTYSPTDRRVALARIPGMPLSEAQDVPDQVFYRLRIVLEDTLCCGVARHSLPARDVIVCPDGTIGMVDFERCTLRSWHFSPIWWIARKVARFNLLRLIDCYAPHLLTHTERRHLDKQYQLRAMLHHYKRWYRQTRELCRRR